MRETENLVKQSKTIPCRLYAILAREAPVGVIFRRGPSRWVQIIHWDTATDTFTPGQWFHGRIYEWRCDLSPDGKLLVYSARKPDAHTVDPEYTDYWTAISKPPYLTALALWPCHSSIGGGLFFSDTKVWLNYYGTPLPHPHHLPKGLWVYSAGNDVLEPLMLHRRLTRDGWERTQEWCGKPSEPSGPDTFVPDIRRKRNPRGPQELTMTTTMKAFRRCEDYSVVESKGTNHFLSGAGWADWDQRGRLVFTRDGKLFALAAEDIGSSEAQELVDLNDHKPAPMEAPEWAKVWPNQ